MTATATRTATRATARASVRAAPAPAPKAPARPPLRVVDAREATRRRRRRGVAWVGLGLLATGLLAVVVSHVLLSQQHYELEQLEREAAQSQRRYDQLRLEAARLEAPERIVEVATTRLGMVAPDEVTYLTPTERVVDAEADRAAAQEKDSRLASAAEKVGADQQAVGFDGPSGWASVKPHLNVTP